MKKLNPTRQKEGATDDGEMHGGEDQVKVVIRTGITSIVLWSTYSCLLPNLENLGRTASLHARVLGRGMVGVISRHIYGSATRLEFSL
jgi:hypothetical protein